MTDICRLCASLKRLDHLMTLADPALAAAAKLSRCCRMDFPPPHDEFLPQNVCFDCVAHLNASYAFAERVHQAQETLRHAFLVEMQLDDGKRLLTDAVESAAGPCTQDAATDTQDDGDDDGEVDDNADVAVSVAVESEHGAPSPVAAKEPTFKVRSVIISLHLKGFSVPQICKRLKLDEHIVSDWIFTYQTYAQCGVVGGPVDAKDIAIADDEQYIDDDDDALLAADEAVPVDRTVDLAGRCARPANIIELLEASDSLAGYVVRVDDAVELTIDGDDGPMAAASTVRHAQQFSKRVHFVKLLPFRCGAAKRAGRGGRLLCGCQRERRALGAG